MGEIRLSIIMANYNHGEYLYDRISSFLAQMDEQDELIIVDDASTDNSVSIIEKFQDARLTLIKNKKNLGCIQSASIAAHAARGRYLFSAAADDIILAGFISKTMNVLLKNPQIGLCCSDCASIYIGFADKSPEQIYSAHLLENIEMAAIFNPQQIRKIFWETFFWIPGHTTIVRKDLFFKYGGITERLGSLCDWFLYHTIALNAGVAYIPETLAVWREDMNSYSHKIGMMRQRRRQFQMEIFKVLSENKLLRCLFRKSGLLHYHVRPNLMPLLLKPQYWDFLFSFVHRFLYFRRIKYFRMFKQVKKSGSINANC